MINDLERWERAEQLLSSTLKNYQVEGVRKMLTSRSLMQGDDMGLGKTLQTLVTLESQTDRGPVIIFAPKFALAVWQDEISKWFGLESTIYDGTPAKRRNIWNAWIKNPTPYLITNFAKIQEIGTMSGIQHKAFKQPPDKTNCGKVPWKAIVVDEAHMSGISNYKTNFYKAIKVLAKDIPSRYILSGTFVRKGCIDLFGPLSIINPNKFKNYWSYVNNYCVTIDGPFGKTIERNPANIKAFREMLSYYYIGRKKEDVLTELPGKRRQRLKVDMSANQRKVYQELTEELMTLIPDTGEFIVTPSTMTLILRLRQLLVSPELLGSGETGPAIDAIIEHSHLRLDANVPVCVFTSFRTAIPLLERAFKKEYPGIKIFKIQGGLSAEEFGQAWQSFQKETGPRVLLVVIKSGASFQATAADTAYFLGPEWDVTLNLQAEDRLNRIGQKNFVNIFYVDYGTEVEGRVWQLLNEKAESADLITGTSNDFRRVLLGRTNMGN